MSLEIVDRREFLQFAGAMTLCAPDWMNNIKSKSDERGKIPSYLKGYEDLYTQNPRKAALQWFRETQFGLFIHYGLYSLDGIHPFEQFYKKIPVKKYEKKMHRFTAEKFDTDFITSLAVEAGMKYVNLVSKHCEGFCLWDTKQTDFNSVNSAAKRDFIAEMAESCSKKGLGLFLFYEHGFEWHHPHGPRRKDWPTKITEVDYDPSEPTYAYGDAYDFNKYLDYAAAQITELLTNYGPVAGIWLDGAAVPASGDHGKWRLQELYDMIHSLQPQALISYKWGITGTEDFMAPEAQQVQWAKDSKPMEVCIPLNKGWGYVKDEKREDANFVMAKLNELKKKKANMLLNIGPLPDGSVHPDDIKTLREVGRRIKQSQFYDQF